MTSFIYISGSFLALFLGLLILSKKKKRPYDYILGIWLLLISVHIAVFYLQEIALNIPLNWIALNAVFPLLQGVFLYLYTGLLLQKIQFKPSTWLHFLPFIIFSILITGFGGDVIHGLLILSVVLSGFIYIAMSFQMTGGFHSFFKHNNHWLKILVSGLGLVWLIFIVIGMSSHLLGFSPVRHEIIFVSVNIFVFAVGYFGLKEGHILQEPQVKGKYDSSPLLAQDFDKIGLQLDTLMEGKRVFLNPNLKIGNLANELSMPTHYLSQYFNVSLNTNYYDYINSLRIAELKSRISDGQLDSLSLLGLAYDCGFNSKATLNRVFKKQTGQTPSGYIKSLK